MAGAANNGLADRRALALRTVYALCLIGATCNHAISIHQHGLFWDHGGLPKASAIFWTMLVLVDPAAAVLLFTRPNAGVEATAAIIVVDVIHNLWIEARYFPPLLEGLADSPKLIAQIAFMVFVTITAPLARTAKQRTAL